MGPRGDLSRALKIAAGLQSGSMLLRCLMGRSSLLCIALAVILVVLSAGISTAQPPPPQVFTGPDLGRYFERIWLPDYPFAARRNRVSGRGTYRAYLEASGKVTRVIVIKSAGSRDLDDAVVLAALKWKGRPGKKREVDFPMAFLAPPR
jgi:TonB family protein